MKTALLYLAILVLVMPSRAAVESERRKATFLAIEKKAHDRVMYYIGNTPIIKQEPYYAMVMLSGQITYEVEYELRNDDEELPDTFAVGAEVAVRVAGRHLFLKRPGGGELNTLIVKRVVPKASTREPARDSGHGKPFFG